MAGQRRTYTLEQKASAIARVLAGEAAAAVARDLDVDRTALQKWIADQPVVTPVTEIVTSVSHAHTREDRRAERLRDDLSDLMHAEMTALQRQAEFYGSDDWLTKQPPSVVLESTRTLRRAVHATMDRLAGRGAEAADAGPEAGD